MATERKWIYARKGTRRLYCRVKNELGKWENQATPYTVGDEKRAIAYAQETQRGLDEKRAAAAAIGVVGIPTVAEYAARWVAARLARKLRSAKDDGPRLAHAHPHLGTMRLDEVRVRHVAAMVDALKLKIPTRELAPRTVLHVYRTLHTMFQSAVRDELVLANPCQLGRDDLPKKVDKTPGWRATAVYTREELEELIASDRLPADRRVLYALLGLTSGRFGEVAALRWSYHNRSLEPLGSISIHESYDKDAGLGPLKTENPRLVPVHPVLERLLAWWWRAGWEQAFGRPPTEQDLIIPSRRLRYRSVRLAHKRLQQDLLRLGHRKRRTHDLRRTFITLARADGARKDILRWVTHGPEGDIVDLYTSLPWATLCEAVAVLRIAAPPIPGEPVRIVAPTYATPAAVIDPCGPNAIHLDAPPPPAEIITGATVIPFPRGASCNEVVRSSSLQPAQLAEIASDKKRGGRDSNPSQAQAPSASGVKPEAAGAAAGPVRTDAGAALVTVLEDAISRGDTELALALTRRLRELAAPPAAAPAPADAAPPIRKDPDRGPGARAADPLGPGGSARRRKD